MEVPSVRKAGFQMEAMAEVNPPTSATLRLMVEAQRRGYQVLHFCPRDVYIQQGEVWAEVAEVEVQLDETPCYVERERHPLALRELDILHIRQDPPVDMEYITSTYLLERLEGHVQLVNPPAAIRDLPEKLYPLQFPCYVPPTLITYHQPALDSFRQAQGDIVLKPLYGFHGHGIRAIMAGEEFTMPDSSEPIIFQKFIPEIYEGNKRIVLLNGEVAASIITVPGEGEFKVYRNSSDHCYNLNARDAEICQAVGDDLKRRGVVFAGIDIIGDYLTEINVTSVGGIHRINQLYDKKFESDVWDAVEKAV